MAFFIGLLVRVIMSKRRGYEEAGTTFFEHILALVSLIAAGGLVWLGFQAEAQPSPWIEPFLGAIVIHYFGTR